MALLPWKATEGLAVTAIPSDLKILRNSALNAAGYGAPALLAVFSVPLTIRLGGMDAFSVLSVMWSAISLSVIFFSGISLHAVMAISSAGDAAERGTAAGTGLALQLAFSGTLAVILAAGAPELAGLLFDSDVGDPVTVLRLAAAAVPLAAAASVASAALTARGDFLSLNAARAGFESFYAITAPAAFISGAGLPGAALAVAVGKVCEAMVLFLLARRGGYLGAGWRFSRPVAGKILGFAWPASMQRLGFQAGDEIGNIIAGSVSGLAGLSAYSLPQKIYRKLVIIPASAAGALLPVFSRSPGRAYMRRAVVKSFLVSVAPFLVLALAAPQVLTLLAGYPPSPESVLALRLLLLARLVSGVFYLAVTWLQASGRPGLPASVTLLSLCAFSALAWYWAVRYGVWGIAAAWALKSLCESSVTMVLAWRLPAHAAGYPNYVPLSPSPCRDAGHACTGSGGPTA